MTEDASEIVLSMRDLREVLAFAAACAETVLDVFEAERPDDPRPREAIGAAWEFARGGERGKALRTKASAALTDHFRMTLARGLGSWAGGRQSSPSVG
ncbi:putative immunity protein [Streptomyces longwoodensis]|uniref:putative immunity protein n=1 Tax=Streptomyces longwoodensis TaxID=68231 RepID=UPI0033BBA6B3